MKLSLTKLTELTGKHYRALRSALESVEPTKGPKHSLLYESRMALPLIYGVGACDDGPLDPQAERAQLDRARRLNVELKNAELEGELVPAAEVTALWQRMIAAARAKLLTIPVKAAPLVVAAESQAEAQQILRNEVHAALRELHTEGMDK